MSSKFLLEHPEFGNIININNPEKLYFDFDEIGHGNFGAVFSAKDIQDNSKIVAIKKISCKKIKNENNYSDIMSELLVLTRVDHENMIRFDSAYWFEQTIYIVMEHCIGSLIDILTITKSPFSENNIQYICKCIVKGLVYLHSLDWIHRDIKCANILLTMDSQIKIADFGSSSLKSPANTFIGSPFWMAPEVILAMEDGLYDKNCDVWSLGITLIELAEMKPPRFEMNTMSALYYIAQNEPPQLKEPSKWSNYFIDFLNCCLVKEPENRLNSNQLLINPFINDDKTSNNEELAQVVSSCFNKAHNLDEETYQKIKTLVKGMDFEKTSLFSSKNNSINSALDLDNPNKKKSQAFPARTNTLKIATSLIEESSFYEKDGINHNLDEYRQLRKNLRKQILSVENKLKIQEKEFIKVNDKTIEIMFINIDKAIEKAKTRHSLDFEQLLKLQINAEKRINKRSLSTFRKKITKADPNIIPDLYKLRKRQEFERFMNEQQQRTEILLVKKTEYINYFEALLNFKQSLKQIKMEHEKTISDIKLDQLKILQDAEMYYQNSYNKKLEVQLRKKHLSEIKSTPKAIKNCESNLRKIYNEQVRAQTIKFRSLIEEADLKTPKEKLATARDQIKRDRMTKLAKLESDFQDLLAKNSLEVQEKLDIQQELEKANLNTKLVEETEILKKSQMVTKSSLEALSVKKMLLVDKESELEYQKAKDMMDQFMETIMEEEKKLYATIETERNSLLESIENEILLYEKQPEGVKFPISASEILQQTVKGSPMLTRLRNFY